MNHEWILALETTVASATLLLARDGEAVARRDFTSERSQECDLFAPLQDILTELPTGAQLSAIIIGTGPGSYNGARVGIAAAQALAQTHGCRVAGLCSFEGVTEASQHPSLYAIGDARRGSYFLMPVLNGRAQAPPRLLEKADFLQALTTDNPNSHPMVTFESPDRLPAELLCTESTSTAGGLLASWLTRTPEEQNTLLNTPTEAFYLRPPHITKAKKKGSKN